MEGDNLTLSQLRNKGREHNKNEKKNMKEIFLEMNNEGSLMQESNVNDS
eukprot:CAMPEP_0170558354 /NCGR_PEP_ID=MMETSP0211-20121228/34746_1 /TAXON_ID=311385 /ORGANISM="Pseudokeronopsis sp., Strain OXSARD2" /LENGTH=48 /DNA_ID= /DNA_START= /DNA_END= /DNA_ORIENTATION=